MPSIALSIKKLQLLFLRGEPTISTIFSKFITPHLIVLVLKLKVIF